MNGLHLRGLDFGRVEHGSEVRQQSAAVFVSQGLFGECSREAIVKLAAVVCEGLLAPCARAIRSLVICCFCSP